MKSIKVIGILLFCILFYIIYKAISQSIYLQNQERINVLFYGKTPVFYSVSSSDVNYTIPLTPTNEVLVPGGYGYYKIGGIGKLVYLEKKPDIFRKTISANFAVSVDIYFYSNNPIIYYDDSVSISPQLPSFQDVFLSSSNASILDRIFIYYGFVRRKRNQFTLIKDLPKKLDRNKIVLNREETFKQLQGYFYKKSYRKEKSTVQILYTNKYQTALIISQILEGEGIRVIDISKTQKESSRCSIIQNTLPFSQTAVHMKTFYQCDIKKGNAEISDILFHIGNLEQDWAVQ